MFQEESDEFTIVNGIEPFREIIAYEALWNRNKSSFKTLSELFKNSPGKRPSDLATDIEIELLRDELEKLIWKEDNKYKPNLLINNSLDYPSKLKDAQEPVEVLYYSGNLDYLFTDSIAVVGSRKASDFGIRRAKKITKLLVNDGFTIVSGLATGIDTVAHTTAIANKGKTIAVIGTPLNEFYPKENQPLQEYIAHKHLLISQVPYYRYSKQSFRENRLFFPQRNKTMSAITDATIIIEASETSGTLIQATAALYQNRKLFILDSCFENKNITWPTKFLELGAIRVKEYEDISIHLTVPNDKENR